MEAKLVAAAFQARENSYSPYSGFRVGAALLTAEGRIYTGTNIECASYGATNCAERTAFFKAVSEGERNFKSIAIVGGYDNEPGTECYPCGICRQVMAEFCANAAFEIIVACDRENYKKYLLCELLPFSFGNELNKPTKI